MKTCKKKVIKGMRVGWGWAGLGHCTILTSGASVSLTFPFVRALGKTRGPSEKQQGACLPSICRRRGSAGRVNGRQEEHGEGGRWNQELEREDNQL